jgi:hypothetical protein
MHAVSALTLLIIRHGEKPKENWPGPGSAFDGTEDGLSLVIRGWQRAGAWAALFGAGMETKDYPQPTVIYAVNPNPDPAIANPESSHRPFETITPLSERLRLTPITKYAVGQEADLVSEITGLTGVVLVCWEHKHIVSDILPKIANGQILPGLPSKWKGDRFDVVLRFDRVMAGAPWSFRQLFPRLLAGDSEVPLPSSG